MQLTGPLWRSAGANRAPSSKTFAVAAAERKGHLKVRRWEDAYLRFSRADFRFYLFFGYNGLCGSGTGPSPTAPDSKQKVEDDGSGNAAGPPG